MAAPYHVIGEGVWVAGSLLTNPEDTDILVDTGELPGGVYLFAVSGASDSAWVYDVQRRNAANTSNIASQRRRPPAGSEDFMFPNKIIVAPGERLRVVLVGGVTGEVQMSIYYEGMTRR